MNYYYWLGRWDAYRARRSWCMVWRSKLHWTDANRAEYYRGRSA